MRILENGVYRDATAEEIANSIDQEEPTMEFTLEERLAQLEALLAAKGMK